MTQHDPHRLSTILGFGPALTQEQRDAYWTWVFRATRYPVADRVVDKVSRNIRFIVHTDRWLSPRSVY